MTDKVDRMAGAVEGAVTAPARKAAAFSAGVSEARGHVLQARRPGGRAAMKVFGSFVGAAVVAGAGLAYYVHQRHERTRRRATSTSIKQLPGDVQRVTDEARRRAAEAFEQRQGRGAAHARPTSCSSLEAAGAPSPSSPRPASDVAVAARRRRTGAAGRRARADRRLRPAMSETIRVEVAADDVRLHPRPHGARGARHAPRVLRRAARRPRTSPPSTSSAPRSTSRSRRASVSRCASTTAPCGSPPVRSRRRRLREQVEARGAGRRLPRPLPPPAHHLRRGAAWRSTTALYRVVLVKGREAPA